MSLNLSKIRPWTAELAALETKKRQQHPLCPVTVLVDSQVSDCCPWATCSTSRYLDDLLNIDNPYFEGKVNQIYPFELQLNKANTTDTEAPFSGLSIANGFFSSKIYDKRDNFD